MNIQFIMKLFFFLLVCCSTTSLIGQEKSISALKIGNLEWQKMNLNVSTFANGDTIFQAKTPEEWKNAYLEKKSAWCYYEFSVDNDKKYGKLYNWFAVNDNRGLAPKGWRIPTEAEFETIDQVEKYFIGDKLKASSGWDKWESVDENGVKKVNSANGNNSTGFSALPAGCVDYNGVFHNKGIKSFFWTKTEFDTKMAVNRGLRNDHQFIHNFTNKGFGYSVRCIK
jgi:uncharacterized protein (TIGR02145 family)